MIIGIWRSKRTVRLQGEYDELNETSLVAKTGAVPVFCWVAPWERCSPHRWWLYSNSLWMWLLWYHTDFDTDTETDLLIFGTSSSMRRGVRSCDVAAAYDWVLHQAGTSNGCYRTLVLPRKCLVTILHTPLRLRTCFGPEETEFSRVLPTDQIGIRLLDIEAGSTCERSCYGRLLMLF